jgi:prepilin-type N-terminal cleavage/methylation domain-containing protein
MNGLQSQRGFSLVEILTAMSIFGITVIGLAGMGNLALASNVSSGRTTSATTLAQARMEYVKGLEFSSIDAAAATEDYGSMPGAKLFRRVTSVATDASNPDVKTVVVTVFWGFGKHKVTLQTLVTKAGL